MRYPIPAHPRMGPPPGRPLQASLASGVRGLRRDDSELLARTLVTLDQLTTPRRGRRATAHAHARAGAQPARTVRGPAGEQGVECGELEDEFAARELVQVWALITGRRLRDIPPAQLEAGELIEFWGDPALAVPPPPGRRRHDHLEPYRHLAGSVACDTNVS